jgi:hypothetical protein
MHQTAATWANVETVIDAVRHPLLVLGAPDLRVRRANRSFYRTFNLAPGDTEGRIIYDLGNRQWDLPALRKLLEEVLPRQAVVDDFEVAHDPTSAARSILRLNARPVG